MTSMVCGHCTKNCISPIIIYKSDIIVDTVIVLDQRCSNKQGVTFINVCLSSAITQIK